MAFPVVPVALAAAVVLGGKYLYDQYKASHPSAYNPLPGAVPAQMVTGGLKNGTTYMVVMMVQPVPGGDDTPEGLGGYIATGLNQIALVPVGVPAPRGDDDKAAFAAKKPSQWAVLARWEGTDGTRPSGLPGYISGMNFYAIPASV